MITLSLTLQVPRSIIRELLPSDPDPVLKPGQALDHLVSISRAHLHKEAFTLSDLLDKPWPQVSSLLPPGTCLHFYRA